MDHGASEENIPLGWGSAGFFESRQHPRILYQLYAAGHENVDSPGYCWDGMTRTDGPLYLFQYTLTGHGRLETGGTSMDLGPGWLMMLPIPDRHCYRLPKDSTHWEFLYVLVRQENLLPLWSAFQPQKGPAAQFPPDHPAIVSLQDLVRAVLTPQSRNVWQRSALIYQLFMDLIASTQEADTQNLPVPEGIARVKEALQRDFSTLLSLDSMADMARMSKYHFLRSFKKHAGCTPGEYLAELRLHRAIQLLQGGQEDLDSIARACGFSGASYFIKVFRHHTGMTPGEFRSRPKPSGTGTVHWIFDPRNSREQ